MYEFERTVYHCDAGADGLLKLDSAAAMLMDCCQFQEYSEVRFREWLERNHTAVFLSSLQLDLLRRPAFREKIRVRVVIYDCKSIYGFRRITMRGENNELLMIANGIGCFFNFATGKAVKLPENIEDYISFDSAEDDPMEVLPRKIIQPAGEGIALEPFKVMRSDLDLNRHLTSARYFAVAEDRLPADFRYDRVRIEFKHQVKCGETVQPFLYRDNPETALILMQNSAGLLNALVEFSSREHRNGV